MSATRSWRARRSRRSKSSASGWDGSSSGSRPSTTISITTSMSHSDLRTSLQGALSTISGSRRNGRRRYKTCPAAACSTKTRPVRSSTLTPPIAVAARMCSEFMQSSTRCRKAATRTVPTDPWAIGRDRGPCMERAAPLRAMAAITRRPAAAPPGSRTSATAPRAPASSA